MANETLQGQYAGFVSRAAAFLVDIIILSLTIFLTSLVLRVALGFAGIQLDACAPLGSGSVLGSLLCHATSAFLVGFTILLPPVYLTMFWTVRGQTPGKFLLGLRVVQTNGQHISFITALRRYAGYVVSLLSLGLGFFNILVDDRRQGWHDKFAGTFVIYAWAARANENFLQKFEEFLDERSAINLPKSPRKPG